MTENAENNSIAVKVAGVKKQYKLGQIGGGTLQADLQSWWAKIHGREDPNSKIYEGERSHGDTFMALNGIDMTIYKGQAIGILGKNGAGKSTLLKILSRVTAPTEGEVDIYGRVASMLEVGTGFNGEMTGRENVYLNGAILGMTKSEIDAKMEDIIEFSEVREFIDTPVKRYSSGMYVKLAFSVAAHLDSEIMIMDEVLAVGDMAFQKKCLDKMRAAAKKEGRTVLYVSHNMNTIRQLCDKCFVLDQGKVIFEGDTEEAISLYMYDAENELGTDFDLSESRMGHLSNIIRAKITHLTLLNKPNAIFEYGEPMKMKISIKAYEDIGSLCMRFEIRSLSGLSVGLSSINNFSPIVKDNCEDFLFELNMPGLVIGKYVVCLVLYEVGESGIFVDLDAIFPTFVFEIRDSKNLIGIVWNHNNWGYIKLPDMKVLTE